MFKDNDNDFLGEYMAECPRCHHRFNKRMHGNKCPDCGYRKGFSKYIFFIFPLLILLLIIFKDFFLNIKIPTNIVSLFNRVNLVYFLIIINIVLYLLGFNSSNSDIYGSCYYDTIKNKEYYRLLSSGFTHADLLHLLCNVCSLYNLGSFAYSRLGGLLFLLLYFICLVVGGLLSIYFHHSNGDDDIRSVGASGAICGLLGYYIVFVFKMNIDPIQTSQYIYNAVLPLGITIFNPRVDNIGHASGLIVGLLLSFLLVNVSPNLYRTTKTSPIVHKQTCEAIQVVIYEDNSNNIKDSFYVCDIDSLNKSINDCLQTISDEFNSHTNISSINVSILERIAYGDTVYAANDIVFGKDDIQNHLLYGDNGNPIVTFIVKCVVYQDGQYIEKLFYNNVEQ